MSSNNDYKSPSRGFKNMSPESRESLNRFRAYEPRSSRNPFSSSSSRKMYRS